VQLARKTLDTAGIALETDVRSTELPPSHEAVLCLALREAVTNIVRHSGARACRISVASSGDACSLVVADDGRGGDAPFGSGLSGMRERVEILGGSLKRDGRHGTTITATLPLTARAEVERSA
jgi:two-component system sensor histidine kinase DesK